MSHTDEAATSTSEPAPARREKTRTVARFMTVVGEVIGVDPVPAGEHFLDLGGDSLDAVIVTDILIGEFGRGPELDWFFEIGSVEGIAEEWWGLLSA